MHQYLFLCSVDTGPRTFSTRTVIVDRRSSKCSDSRANALGSSEMVALLLPCVDEVDGRRDEDGEAPVATPPASDRWAWAM